MQLPCHPRPIAALWLYVAVVTVYDTDTAIAFSFSDYSPSDELTPTSTQPSYYVGDGYCDDWFNSFAYDYDGGDCCECTCTNGIFECGAVGFDCQNPSTGCEDDDVDAGGSGVDVGAIVGGVIGGMAAIGAILAGLYYRARRRRSGDTKSPPFNQENVKGLNTAHYPVSANAPPAGVGYPVSAPPREAIAYPAMVHTTGAALATVGPPAGAVPV